MQRRAVEGLRAGFGPRPPVDADSGQGLKARVGEDVDAPVVRFEVVDLFAVEEGPEVFADEFDRVERC